MIHRRSVSSLPFPESPSGAYMPPEWEPHEGTWLQWPFDRHFPGYQLQLERLWLMMVAALQEHERLHILVRDERLRDHVGHQMDYFGIGRRGAELIVLPYDDVWARDNGPTFVHNREGGSRSSTGASTDGGGGSTTRSMTKCRDGSASIQKSRP
jgi:agmatine/peptidylarginine deiminase